MVLLYIAQNGLALVILLGHTLGVRVIGICHQEWKCCLSRIVIEVRAVYLWGMRQVFVLYGHWVTPSSSLTNLDVKGAAEHLGYLFKMVSHLFRMCSLLPN